MFSMCTHEMFVCHCFMHFKQITMLVEELHTGNAYEKEFDREFSSRPIIQNYTFLFHTSFNIIQDHLNHFVSAWLDWNLIIDESRELST